MEYDTKTSLKHFIIYIAFFVFNFIQNSSRIFNGVIFLLGFAFAVFGLSNTFWLATGFGVGLDVVSVASSNVGLCVGSGAFSCTRSGLAFFYWKYLTSKFIKNFFFCIKK